MSLALLANWLPVIFSLVKRTAELAVFVLLVNVMAAVDIFSKLLF